MEILLAAFDNYKEAGILNGEPIVMTTAKNRSDGSLDVYLDSQDPSKIVDLLRTCRVRWFSHMVSQNWVVKDGRLYLDNQDNNSTSYLCKGTVYAREAFRGGARKLWCMFLRHGIESGVLTDDTIIDLEARGFLASQQITQDVDEAQLLLIDFYKRLGFKLTGRHGPRGEKYPYMTSTVGETLKTVC